MEEDLEQYYIYNTHKNENNEIVNEVEVDLHDNSQFIIFKKSDNDSFCFFEYNMHKNDSDNDYELIDDKEINKNLDKQNQDNSHSLIFVQQSRDVSSFIRVGSEEEINSSKSLLIFLPEKTDSKKSSYIANEVDVFVNKNQENLYNLNDYLSLCDYLTLSKERELSSGKQRELSKESEKIEINREIIDRSEDEIRNNTILKNSIYSSRDYDIADLFAEVDFTENGISDKKSDFDNLVESEVSNIEFDLNDIQSEQSDMSIIEHNMSSIAFDLSNSYEYSNSSINENSVDEKELSILIELSRLFPEVNNDKINHIINNNFTNNNLADEHKSLNSSYAIEKIDATDKICNKDKKDKMEYDLVVSEINEEYCEDFKEPQNLKELNFIQNNVGNNIDNNNIRNNIRFEVSEYVLFEGDMPVLENHVKEKPINIEMPLLEEERVINNYYDNKNINNDVFDVYKEQDKAYKSTNHNNDIAFDNLYYKNQKEDYVLNKKAIDIYEQKNVLLNDELRAVDSKVHDAKSSEEKDIKYSVEEEKHTRSNRYIGFYTRKKLGI
jgi:hypothetical protein